MNPTIREENAILLVHPPVAKACEAPGGPARQAGAILPYSASSGCWWRRCSFCPERAEGNPNPYRPLPTAQVTADLRSLVAETRPALIHLLDNALSPALR